ncbi:MAG TPA: hypothetical protein VHC22_10940 [Pirellulales bacterium]|nr:hypothetical protein [Pirellulales bacterium]
MSELSRWLEPSFPPVWAACLTGAALLTWGLFRQANPRQAFLAVLLLQLGLLGIARNVKVGSVPRQLRPAPGTQGEVYFPIAAPSVAPVQLGRSEIHLPGAAVEPASNYVPSEANSPASIPPISMPLSESQSDLPAPVMTAADVIASGLRDLGPPPPDLEQANVALYSPLTTSAGELVAPDGRQLQLEAQPIAELSSEGLDKLAPAPSPRSAMVLSDIDLPGLPGITGVGAVTVGAIDSAIFGPLTIGSRTVLIVDISPSMRTPADKDPTKISRFDRVKCELIRILTELSNTNTEIAVIFFDQGVRWLGMGRPLSSEATKDEIAQKPPKLHLLTPELCADWIRELESLTTGNDTVPVPALKLGLTLDPDEMTLLTDGEFGFPPADAEILKKANPRNIRIRGTLLGEGDEPPASGGLDRITDTYGGERPHYIKD